MAHPQYTMHLSKKQMETLVQLGQEDPDIDGDTILEIVEIAEGVLDPVAA